MTASRVAIAYGKVQEVMVRGSAGTRARSRVLPAVPRCRELVRKTPECLGGQLGKADGVYGRWGQRYPQLRAQ